MTERPTLIFGHSTFWQAFNALPPLLWLVLVVVGAAFLLTRQSGGAMMSILLSGATMVVILVGVYQLLTLTHNAARIELGPRHVEVRMPVVHGLLTLPRLERAELPYEAIAAVEYRTELYSCFGVGWREWAYSLTTRDGRRISLGVRALRLPRLFQETAAEEIAARAGVPLIDRGHVSTGGIIASVLRGTPDWDATAMSGADVKRFDMRTLAIVGAIFGAMAFLALLIHFKAI